MILLSKKNTRLSIFGFQHNMMIILGYDISHIGQFVQKYHILGHFWPKRF